MSREAGICPSCERAFWSDFTFRRHQLRGRCRTDAELRRIGLHRNRFGVWTRVDCPARRQLRLFPLRPGRPHKPPRILRGSRVGHVRRRREHWVQDPLSGLQEAA